MNLSRILSIGRRFLWLFLLVTLVAGLTTYFLISSQQTIYETKTRLLVGPSMDSPSPDLNSLRIGGQLIQTYAELVASRPFLESVNSKLSQKMDLDLLSGTIETLQNVDARILTIYVRHRDPNQAVNIANAIAATLMEQSPSKDNTTALLRSQMSNQAGQLEQIITNSEATIEELEAKLVALGSQASASPEAAQANLEQQNLIISQLTGERARMSEALRTLTSLYDVLSDTNSNQLQVIEPAGTVYPVDQNIPLRVAASALAGLLLAISVVYAIEYFDDKIRSAEDLDRVEKLPQVNIIGKHDRLGGTGLDRIVTFANPNSLAANNYRRAAAKLFYTGGASAPNSYLLTSVGAVAGDEAAVVAANLAVAFAQTGKRVALVDAQFSNRQLTRIFETDEKPGLLEFMATDTSPVKLVPAKNISSIQILPAGIPSEKNMGSGLDVTKLDRLLEQLRNDVDITLVAGDPISWFAESLTLAPHVDGVVLIARPGEAHVKAVKEVMENLEHMNAHLAGVIFDYNQSSMAIKKRSERVFESSPVVPEDSHV